MSLRRNLSHPVRAGLLGLAFDAADGHKRITRGPNFFLLGGSQDTHSVMQETVLKLNEHLIRHGKDLADLSADELRDILGEIRS